MGRKIPGYLCFVVQLKEVFQKFNAKEFDLSVRCEVRLINLLERAHGSCVL